MTCEIWPYNEICLVSAERIPFSSTGLSEAPWIASQENMINFIKIYSKYLVNKTV